MNLESKVRETCYEYERRMQHVLEKRKFKRLVWLVDSGAGNPASGQPAGICLATASLGGLTGSG